ncbi:MAG: DUF4058 family protein [Chloroflexi bacterium]|nr:DUF4058 family protein [Chloroflexota bacterium]
MPSPFPGMDPYLEHPSLWPDVHLNLIHAIQTALALRVAPRYFVSVEQRTYIAAVEPDAFLGRPDAESTFSVAVIGSRFVPPAAPLVAAPAGVLERPLVVEVPVRDEIRQRYLEVRDVATHDVITVIEVLSPTNKQSGEGRQQYEKKRQQVFDSLTSLVEIDLLRGGKPMPTSRLPVSHYRILVSREWERPRAKLYPFNLNETIPEIPVPLRQGEDEPMLSLGDLLAQIYDQVRYDLRLDYALEPEPPLDADVAIWAHGVLAQGRARY